jgi:hypothetical protein
MTDKTVARTILEQLGGNKFVAMTGAKNFSTCGDGLSFKLPGGGGFCKDGINFVQITLTPADDYNVAFGKTRAFKYKEIKKVEGIYFDQLQEVFTRATGLATRLF